MADVKVKKKKGGIGKWFNDIKLELKKVTWPTRKRLTELTIVVLFFCLVLCLLFFAFDEGILALFNKFIYATPQQ